MTSNAWWAPALILFSKVSAIIITPAIILLIVSSFLDIETRNEKIIFFLIAILSFLISMFLVVKIIKKNLKDFNVNTSSDKK